MTGHRRVSMWLPRAVIESLESMTRTGYYGLTIAATAKELTMKAVREEVRRFDFVPAQRTRKRGGKRK